jgi:hypothetical protein
MGRTEGEDSMTALKKLAHREWQDWFGVVLGVLILVSPFMIEESVPGMVMLNAVMVGLVVTIISQFQIFGPTAWEEIVNAACGLWLIASPLPLFGFEMLVPGFEMSPFP